MQVEDLNVYAFNQDEKNILYKHVKDGKIDLSFKDVKIYFQLKSCGGEIGITDLVKKCLLELHEDINSPEMYQPRKKSKKDDSEDEFYKTDTFRGNDEYRVDSYSRALNKLVKSGLVTKRRAKLGNVFQSVVKI